MTPETNALEAIALAAADGVQIDWDAVGGVAATPHDRLLLEHLRQISTMSAVLREDNGAGAPTESAPDAVRQRWLHLDLVEIVGRGSYGTVYKAWDTRLQRYVALKLIADEPGKPAADQEVIDEGRLLARVRHPNVVAVFGAARADGMVGVWMELIPGVTLEELVRRGGTLGAGEAAVLGMDLCRAVAAVVSAGVVHRDIKAQNVMREYGGRVVLMDFGTGGDPAGTQEQLTGTPLYMAPEVLLGSKATLQSDIYSLGVLLFFVVTGDFPLKGRTLDELTDAHRQRRRQRLSDLRPDLPRAYVAAVETALAEDPKRRPSSAAEFEMLLSAVLERQDRQASGIKRSAFRLVAITAAGAVPVMVWLGVRTAGPRSGSAGFQFATPRQITTGGGWEAEPAISPDGSSIAFTSDAAGNPDIWMADSHGGEPLRLTDTPGVDRSPSWLSDGSGLVFVSERGGLPSVWRLPRLGGPATAVMSDADEPSVSPDGKRLAFVRRDQTGNLRVAVASLDDPRSARFVSEDDGGVWDHEMPAWSPDGVFLCYAAVRDIWIVPAAGGRARRLTRDNEYDREPVFAPDGKSVYFSSTRAGTLAIWQVPLEGGPAIRVTNGAGPEGHPRLSSDGKKLTYTTFARDRDLLILQRQTATSHVIRTVRDETLPALSADGRTLAYLTNKWGTATELWVQPIVQGEPIGTPQRLTDYGVSQPTFSPDGRWIAFHRAWNGARDIWVIPSAGGTATRLTDDPAADIHPSWSPDGQTVAFVSERGGGSHVWTIPVKEGQADGPAVQVTRSGRLDLWPSWLPEGKRILFIGQEQGRVPEVWLATPGEPDRQLTQGANARRAEWDPVSNSVLVSATWNDASYQLWSLGLRSAQPVRFQPAHTFGVNGGYADFSISRDGGVLALGREHGDGDIWLLEQP